jgi:hypothetical protein
VFNSPNGANDTSDLTSAANSFLSAYNSQPSGQAGVGYVAAESVLLADDLAGLLGTTLPNVNSSSPLVLRTAGSTVVWRGAFSKLPQLNSPLEVLPFGVFQQSRAKRTTDNYSQYVAFAQQLDTSLSGLISTYLTDANIQGLESNPLVIPVSNTENVKIGAAEGYQLRAALSSLVGILDGLLAYNLDPTSFDFGEDFGTTFASDLGTGTPITPSLYLPPSPFMSLNSGGAADMAGFGAEWISAGTDANSALSVLVTRMANNSTGWVTDVTEGANYTSGNVATAQAGVASFVAALNGTPVSATITNDEGVSASVQVNLKAFYSNPPANLQAFFPSFTFALDQNGTSFDLTPVSGSIVDPTFGGLVVSPGVPSNVLYNRKVVINDEADYAVALEIFAFYDPSF